MKTIYIIGALIFGISTNAQVVCDSITKIPIENVNIISDMGNGTITNKQGVFTIDYYDEFEYLIFSHLIYDSKKIKKTSLKKADTILLKPSLIILNEIILKNFNAKDTLVRVINKIPINYSFTPFNQNGFYREYVEEDSVGVSMTEVYFKSYNENKNDSNENYKSRIIGGRRTKNYSKFGFYLQGGVYNIISKGDIVRQKKGVLDINNHSKYHFKFEGTIINSDEKIYIIGYEPVDDNIKNNKKGQLFIDSKSLAIVQVNVLRDVEKMNKSLKNIDLEKNHKEKMLVLTNSTGIIKYKKHKDKFYLSFIDVFNNLKGFGEEKSFDYEINAKLIVTRITIEDVKKTKTNYNIKKDFNKQVKKIPQMEYWNENNTLLFSKKEQKILNDIKNANN